jgi:uncharacterized protein (TIGR04255 family)
MRFPDSDRVQYNRNPLVEVICQIRFPRILRIETERPVAFQEAVRAEYPRLDVRQSLNLAMPGGSQANSAPVGLSRDESYEFLSRQGDWKIVLASGFLALSTTDYKRWEAFRERLTHAIDALVRHYSPSHFIRLGLRYQDVIVRSELGLEGRPWRELLKASVAGMLSSDVLPEDEFIDVQSLFTYRLDRTNAMARVRHGLARRQNSNELSYLIDADFFSEEPTEVGDALGKLDLFNRESGRLFRWCITEDLHRVMEPQPVAN